MEKLPQESRILLDLYYNKDMSQKEIAEKLNLSQMAVSRRMKRIFSNLYSMIEEESGAKNES